MNRRSLSVAVLLAALGVCLPNFTRPAAALYRQVTKVEGTIGKDIGGVWLAVYQVVPTFRARVEREAGRPAPFDVGPIGAEYAAIFPGKPEGVVITKMADPSASARIGIFEGDIISKVNTRSIVDVAGYQEAVSGIDASWFSVTIKRASLRYTKAALVKIEYVATEGQLEDGTTGIAAERIQVQLSDAILPFANEVEKTAVTHVSFFPSDKQIASLLQEWWKLPESEQPTFINAEHRVTAESNYDAAARMDENLENTSFAIISELQGNPIKGGGGKVIALYGVREITPKRIVGTYVESTFAQAPFPISIEFRGSFTLLRLEDFTNKDLAYRLKEARGKQAERPPMDVPLAPDLPAVLPPKEKNPPPVTD